MLLSKKWSVFVYTLVLITLSVSMAMIVVTNVAILNNTFWDNQLAQTLQKWFVNQIQFLQNRHQFFNSDWGGFVDNFWCPNNLVMSGSINRTTGINTQYFSSGGQMICRGEFNSQDLDLIFTSDYSTFQTAVLGSWDSVNLNGEYAKTADSNFSDSDSSLLSFDSSYYNPDGIDDNFNSDDATAQSSTGNVYASWFLDNDADAKIYWVGVVDTNDEWKSIFWNNTKISDYIDENTNNVISQTPNMATASWVLFFETDTPVELRITEFRKADFDQYGELVPIDKNQLSISTGSWFLQNDGTFSQVITNDEIVFDFVEKNYAIFLKNSETQVAKYTFHFENNLGQKIIIFPIADHINNVFSYLWYKIIINSSGRYIYKLQEIFTSK